MAVIPAALRRRVAPGLKQRGCLKSVRIAYGATMLNADMVNARPRIFCPQHFREFFRAFATISRSQNPFKYTGIFPINQSPEIYAGLKGRYSRTSLRLTEYQGVYVTLNKIEVGLRKQAKFVNRSDRWRA